MRLFIICAALALMGFFYFMASTSPLFPKCFVAHVEGDYRGNHYELSQESKTKAEAVASVQVLESMLPVDSEITDVEIHGEGRQWFCHK